MPWSDDISPLLQPSNPANPSNQTFRQGYLVSYNPLTGANTVEVGGALLMDLPLLNIGDTVNLRGENTAGPDNGDVVILMKMNHSWAILGRVVVPGSGDGQFGSSSFDFDNGYAQNTTDDDITAGAYATYESLSFTVPTWANNALVYGISVAQVQNTSGGADYAELITDINGSGGAQTSFLLQVGDWSPLVHAQSRELFSAAAGGSGTTLLGATVTLDTRIQTLSNNWSDGFKNAVLNGIIIYRNIRV